MSKLRFLIALLAVGIAAPAWSQVVDPFSVPAGKCHPSKGHCVSAIVFFSNRNGGPLEIYLQVMNDDNTANTDIAPIQLTENEVGVNGLLGANAFAKLSPHRKRPHRENGARATRFARRSWRDHRLPFATQLIVFDSNRNRNPNLTPPEPVNTSDLFLMKTDGTHQKLLTRGSSATWSPNGKYIAFHRSASGTGLPIRNDPGAPTADSDIFIMRVPDLDDDVIEEPINITNTPEFIEEDADWSPDGQKIVFTRHAAVGDNPPAPFIYQTGEICVLDLETPDAEPQCLLGQPTNFEDERGPAWSPDGTKIAFMCRNPDNIFEICVMNYPPDGSDPTRLTFNTVLDATPTWSPDGTKILFQRGQLACTMPSPACAQLWLMSAEDSTGETQLTSSLGVNGVGSWGQLWVGGGGPQ